MNEIVKIGCPVCGNVIKIRNVANIQQKRFTCPVCSNKSIIADCKFIGYENAPNPGQQGGYNRPQQGQQNPNQQYQQNRPYQGSNQFPQGYGSSQGQYPNQQYQQNRPAPAQNAYAQTGDIVKVKCTCGTILSFKYKPGTENSIITCPTCQRRSAVREFQRVDQKAPRPNPGPYTTGGSQPSSYTPGETNRHTGGSTPHTPSGSQSKSGNFNQGGKKPKNDSLPPSFPNFGREYQPKDDENDRTRLPGENEMTMYGGFNPRANDLKNQPLATLRVKGTAKIYQLVRGRNTIGKKADTSSASIQIETDTRRMSREHFVIDTVDTSNGVVYYISLFKEKVNPTYVDNTHLEYGDKIRIDNGAQIRLPDMTLLFEIPGTDCTQLN